MGTFRFANQILLILKGALVGFGAIMPGISGGTLCAAFGMYQPLLNVLSHPRKAIKEDGVKLFFFLLGAGLGFIGLSGLAGWLMEKDSLAVTCVFIGFILGTLPEMWNDAGKGGRKPAAYASLLIGFVSLFSILLLLRYASNITIAPNFPGFLFCGVLWGISFIVPGLSSSTLLIFFGLYQPMLEGIAKLSLPVLIPLAIGFCICLLALSKGVNAAYQKWHSQIAHGIIGIIAASILTIIPAQMFHSLANGLIGVGYIAAGCISSYLTGRLFARFTQH